MTQSWIAMCAYLLIALLKFQSSLTKIMRQLLRLLQLNLFDKRDLMALLRGDLPDDKFPITNQMKPILKLTGQQWAIINNNFHSSAIFYSL